VGDNATVSAIVRPSEFLTPDPICVAASQTALHAVIDEEGPESVGGYLGAVAEIDHVVTHRFACTLAGYPGWEWHVTVTRSEHAQDVSVSEVTLAPGPDALMAPHWLPWSQRLRPGDLAPGAVAATTGDDARLAPGWSGEDDLATAFEPGPLHPVNWEAGLGRTRVPSTFGRESAASRWYAGEHGPSSPLARAAPGECRTCGWMLTIGGPLGQMFGVCANLLSPSDGRVVSFDHGCGGHSEASPKVLRTARHAAVLDELALDELDMGHS
jgi:hypothetical protein